MINKIKQTLNLNIIDILKLLFGSLIFCSSVNIFIVPNNLYTSGILGISQLIRTISINIFNLNISFDFSGLLYYIINIPLLIIAYKSISKQFFLRTIIAVTFQTLLLTVIPSPTTPIVSDLLVNVLLGGILCGAGIGMVLSSGASTGGTDIIGIVLSKKNNKFSVGKLALIVNLIIYAITGILNGLEIMIYSILYSAIESYTVDKMHEQNICSTAFIFSKKNPKQINNFIKNDLKRDFTYWHAKGGYDDSRTYIIYTVLSKYELLILEKYIKTIDDQIFMVKSDGVGIKGLFNKKF